MSTTRKSLFALIPALVLWLIVEGGLRLAGISNALDQEDPFVGFEAKLPLFVDGESDEDEAFLVTASNKLRYFNSQRFAKNKHSDARRVFCLGGSTTYGRPYNDATSFCGFVRASLQAIEPATTWEVVNAGGISYASYRVAALVDEIAHYEPDLLVVYTGHNEFLEERTYREIRELPAWRLALNRHLRSLRTYSVVEAVLRPETDAANPRDRDTLSAEVETKLDSSVGLDAYTRDDALAGIVTEHFRVNLERLIERGRKAGAEVMLVVPADNLADSAPFKSEVSPSRSAKEKERFYTAFDAGIEAARDGSLEAAHRLLQHAVRLDPRHASARYEYGRVLVAEGEYTEGRRQLEAARDEDLCPLRARSEIVSTVREVASRLKTPVVDFPAVLAEQEEQKGKGEPPLGANWFLDHVHPTVDGNRVLARAILAQLHRSNWLDHDPRESIASIERAEARVIEGIDEFALGVSMRNLAKVLSWAGKTEEAARSAERALDLLGDDAESFFILSLDASEIGDHPKAIALLHETLHLDPDWVKPRLNLGVELARSGRLEEALEAYKDVLERAPEHPSVHYNLGRVLARMGRFDEAASAFRQSLQINPSDADARIELAGIVSAQSLQDHAMGDR